MPEPKTLGRVDWMPRLKVWRVIWYKGAAGIPAGDYPTKKEAEDALRELVARGNPTPVTPEVTDIIPRIEKEFAPLQIEVSPEKTLRESSLAVVEGVPDLLTVGIADNPTVLDKNISILHELGHIKGTPIPTEVKFLPGFEVEVGSWIWVIENAPKYGITPSQVITHIQKNIRETDGKTRLLEILRDKFPAIPTPKAGIPGFTAKNELPDYYTRLAKMEETSRMYNPDKIEAGHKGTKAPAVKGSLELEIDEKFKGLLPMSPSEGPPLPKSLGIKWPWKK